MVAPRPAGAQRRSSELAGKWAKFSSSLGASFVPPPRRAGAGGEQPAGPLLCPLPACGRIQDTPALLPGGASSRHRALPALPAVLARGLRAPAAPGGARRAVSGVGSAPQGPRSVLAALRLRRWSRPPSRAPCYSHSMSHSPGVSLPSAGHAGSCNTRGRAGADGAPPAAHATPRPQHRHPGQLQSPPTPRWRPPGVAAAVPPLPAGAPRVNAKRGRDPARPVTFGRRQMDACPCRKLARHSHAPPALGLGGCPGQHRGARREGRMLTMRPAGSWVRWCPPTAHTGHRSRPSSPIPQAMG